MKNFHLKIFIVPPVIPRLSAIRMKLNITLQLTGLTNDPVSPTEPIIIPDVHFNKEDGHRIPRANVAKIMIQAMEESNWVRQALYASMPPNFEKGSPDSR